MLDGVRGDLHARLAAWLDAARRALVAHASAYRPPGAGPGQPSPKRPPSGPSREVRFMFASDTADPVRAWRATLVVPPDAGVGTPLALSVMDVMGRPVEDGLFRLAGSVVPVENGRGTIPFELFVGGLKDVRVEFARRNCPVEGGTLSFFDPEEL